MSHIALLTVLPLLVPLPQPHVLLANGDMESAQTVDYALLAQPLMPHAKVFLPQPHGQHPWDGLLPDGLLAQDQLLTNAFGQQVVLNSPSHVSLDTMLPKPVHAFLEHYQQDALLVSTQVSVPLALQETPSLSQPTAQAHAQLDVQSALHQPTAQLAQHQESPQQQDHAHQPLVTQQREA